MLKRQIENTIQHYLHSEETKTLFIWGPRRSGKTTILEKLAQELGVKKYNFDLLSDREKFIPRRDVLDRIVKENKVILIDEVQNFPEATIVIKLLHDEYKTKVIATGSSELRQKSSTSEFDTLAGRFNEIYCLPLSIYEILDNKPPNADDQHNVLKQLTSQLQIFGAYPEVYVNTSYSENETIDLLQRMVDTYVLKDIINIYELKDAKLAKDILTKIALQLGNEVSIREIASSLGAYPSTVSNYIEIFIKNYILIPLPSFKVNARRAVSENRKLYFYDLGIRNMLVKDFRDLSLRPDKGGVFENFIISELEKWRRVSNSKVNFYFYREYGGKEVDLVVEDYKKNYTVLEIKVNEGGVKNIFPLPHTAKVITAHNYAEIIERALSI